MLRAFVLDLRLSGTHVSYGGLTLLLLAVGAISEADHVNSIIAAGRADLCAVARPHLANPAWTLTEAAKIGWTAVAWPKQYLSGKTQMETLFAREKAQQSQPAYKEPA